MRVMVNQKRLAFLLVVLLLLPFVVLCFYSHPSLDDFSDALQRRTQGFWVMQYNLYMHLTGRLFTSVLLSELSPVAHGALSAYWLVPLLTLVLLMSSLYFLVVSVVGRSWSTSSRVLAAAILLALWLLQNPSVAESVYWFNGLAVYTVPTALLVYWLATLVRYWLASTRAHAARWLALNVLLGTCVLWSNEIIALPLVAATAGLALWEWQRGGRRRLALAGVLVWFCAALAVSFLAPGNMARAGIIDVPVPIAWVLMGSAGGAAYMVLNWTSSGVLVAVTLLAWPALTRLVAAPPPAIRRLASLTPAAIGVAGACVLLLLPLAAVPNYWATGGLMPPRARASMYLLFLLGWFAVAVAGLAVSKKTPWLRSIGVLSGWSRPVVGLVWGWLLLSLATDHNLRLAHRELGRASNNAVRAYRDWLSGSAARYNATLRSRYQQLRTTEEQHVQVAALAKDARPKTLLYYDITTDKNFGINIDYAKYFYKKYVWTGPGGTGIPPKFYQAPAEDE